VAATLLPASVFRENAKRWSLTGLPIDVTAQPPPWSIVKLKNRTVSPVVEAFIKELRSVVRSKFAEGRPAV